mgnify:CR=1 FL=1
MNSLLRPAKMLAGTILLAFACSQLLCCALRQPPAPDRTQPSAREAWNAFWGSQNASQAWSGYSLKASLNLFTPEESRRITLDLWGNYGLPLRIDLHAGLGTTFAMWRVDPEGLLAYYPREHRAFVHRDSIRAAARLGLNIPFSVQEIARILTGRWQGIIPRTYSRAEQLEEAGWSYNFSGEPAVNRLILDRRGRIVRLEGQAPYEWSLTCKGYEAFNGHDRGQHLVLRTERNERSVLRIKALELRKKPWPASALQIELPPNTMLVPLERTSSEGRPAGIYPANDDPETA